MKKKLVKALRTALAKIGRNEALAMGYTVD